MAQDNKKTDETLFNLALDKYNPEQVSPTFLEQYKAYIASIDKISDRRLHANSYFLSLNTGLCALLGYLLSRETPQELKAFCWVLPVAGIIVSFFWERLVASYRQLNSGKFLVLHSMEQKLPLSPYKAEWIALGEGKDKNLYQPLTHIEVWIPRLFIVLYLLFILLRLPCPKFFCCQ